MAMKVVYTNFCGQLIHEDRGGVETEYVPDTLGSVMKCRSATGTTTYTADYWPYGEVAGSTGTNAGPWGFGGTLGYYTDSVSGSLYVRARILLPNYGRWATVDPLWPGEAAYVYGNSCPVQEADPYGLFPGIWDCDLRNCDQQHRSRCIRNCAGKGGIFLCIQGHCVLDLLLGQVSLDYYICLCKGDVQAIISTAKYAFCVALCFGTPDPLAQATCMDICLGRLALQPRLRQPTLKPICPSGT